MLVCCGDLVISVRRRVPLPVAARRTQKPILDDLQGQNIEVESSPGSGSLFRVVLTLTGQTYNSPRPRRYKSLLYAERGSTA